MALMLADLVRTVVGLCYKIYEEGGSHLSSEDYIESVKDELNRRNLQYRQNEVVQLEYLGKIVDQHLIEFIIEDKILLDLKGRILFHHDVFYKQLTAYLVKENLPVAFVVDFHSRRLALRRVTNPNYNYQLFV
jgi:GxxExxY protein